MNELNPMVATASAIVPASSENAVARSDQQRVIAEVQAAMMLAKANPRDVVKAADRILIACQRPTLAEHAVYQYARGGTDISGPSIRLAEAIAQQWGNIKTSLRELEQVPAQGGQPGYSIVQTIAWDLESGYQSDKVFHVPHARYTKAGGMMKLTDPRDVYEMIANQGARRLRSCILAVIPGDVTDAAVKQCERTLAAKADVTPEGQKALLAAFAEFGVTKEQIETRIQRRIDAITPAQVVGLKKVYTSLRDGMSSPDEWFETPLPPAGGDAPKANAPGAGLAAAVKRARAKAPQGPSPKDAPAEPPASTAADEPSQDTLIPEGEDPQ